MFHYMDHKEAIAALRKAGFNHAEIERITRLRKQFVHNELDQSHNDHRRLEFMRWLFQKGRLTDFAS
ncbi:hypothetical protein [Dictyobacter kobayashii]|uniref:Uncharacterized protein n=1 Tax=Dictyobacter kobayashii TaxID=2014872 RepID=A0A402ALF2_9CHLR|nr:hypothetical protein [Dictyobacter kobayashii]GCE19961.1 hypothetical protein KDK_37610 [Dictyobacter kobayashii]